MPFDLKLPKMTSDEFESLAKPNLLQVFNFPCNFTIPFTKHMTERLLIYCEIRPSEELLKTIVEIAVKNGERGFYFSFVDLNEEEIIYPGVTESGGPLKTWFIPFENIGDYLNQYFILGHFLYSSQGTWGLYKDEDDFLLIGGTPRIIGKIRQSIPNLDGTLDEFFEDWKIKKEKLNANLYWIPKLLAHIYGQRKAEELLKDNCFIDRFEK